MVFGKVIRDSGFEIPVGRMVRSTFSFYVMKPRNPHPATRTSKRLKINDKNL